MKLVDACCTLQLAIAGFLLAILGANLHDPYLLPVRGWALPALLAASGVGLGLLWMLRRHRLLLLIWLAIPLACLGAEASFQLRKQSVLAADSALARDLGQHFIVGYSRLDQVETLASKGLIGGIFVTSPNVSNHLGQDIAQLQQRRREAGLPPLIVATDQEGGIVSHLSPPLTALPALAALTGLAPEQRVLAARQAGQIHGRELAALGVTVNFAPVVDLRPTTPAGHWDFHSMIARRAISEDPAMVVQIAQSYAEGLSASGVRPTLKHFPGLGRVPEDTHHFRASLATDRATLEASDWRPFRQLLPSAGAWLMVGHVTVDAVDPDHPASHSRRLIDGVIRHDWGYQGVIVTDDLTMSAVYQHGYCAAVLGALNAGADLLLISFDGEQYYRAMDCALKGRLDPAMLRLSAAGLAADRSSPSW
jgi:beta-N-acetylhexosaminidase